MEESAWLCKCRNFNVSSSFSWNAVIRSDLKEMKVSKDLAKDRNAWKSFIWNRKTHISIQAWKKDLNVIL